jgi:hypothetical protein
MAALVLVGLLQWLMGIQWLMGGASEANQSIPSPLAESSAAVSLAVGWLWGACALLGFGLLLWNQAIRILKGRGTNTFTIGVIGCVMITVGGASVVMETWSMEKLMLILGGVVTIIAAAIPFTASQTESP